MNFEISRLGDTSSIDPYAHFTFPLYRSLLQKIGKDPSVVALSATVNGEPAGLSLIQTSIEPDDPSQLESAWIRSLFVKPGYRNRKIGRALLEETESLLGQQNCPRLKTRYLSSFKSFAFERLLAVDEWEKKHAGTICYASKQNIPNSDLPDWLHKVKRLERKLSSNCEIFLWSELTDVERSQLEAKVESDISYRELTPFIDEDLLETRTSFGLREDGYIVGWLVNHRIAPKVIRYTRRFVDPKSNPLHRGALMLVKSLSLLPEDYSASFNFAPDNIQMSRFVRHHLQPYITDIRKEYIATKYIATKR